MKPLHLLLLATAITASLSSCSKEEESPVETPATSGETTINNTQTARAADEKTAQDIIEHGEKAHEVHCYKCHTDEVYTRENRFVKSIDALSKQVVRCKDGNDVPWFDADTEAVVQFLNNKYYRF